MGNITRDISTKTLPTTTVAEFGIAMNSKWKTQSGEDREDVCYVDCAAFGKQGETIAKYFKKGDPILLDGKLKYDSWEGKDGTKRSKLSLIVERFSFVGGKREDSSPKNSNQGDIADSPTGEAGKHSDDDLPF